MGARRSRQRFSVSPPMPPPIERAAAGGVQRWLRITDRRHVFARPPKHRRQQSENEPGFQHLMPPHRCKGAAPLPGRPKFREETPKEGTATAPAAAQSESMLAKGAAPPLAPAQRKTCFRSALRPRNAIDATRNNRPQRRPGTHYAACECSTPADTNRADVLRFAAARAAKASRVTASNGDGRATEAATRRSAASTTTVQCSSEMLSRRRMASRGSVGHTDVLAERAERRPRPEVDNVAKALHTDQYTTYC